MTNNQRAILVKYFSEDGIRRIDKLDYDKQYQIVNFVVNNGCRTFLVPHKYSDEDKKRIENKVNSNREKYSHAMKDEFASVVSCNDIGLTGRLSYALNQSWFKGGNSLVSCHIFHVDEDGNEILNMKTEIYDTLIKNEIYSALNFTNRLIAEITRLTECK